MEGILEYFEKEYPDLHIRDVIECDEPMSLNDLSKEYFKKQFMLYAVMQAQPENAKCEIPNWDKSGRCFKCNKLVEDHD